jgi:hypothetical protein
VDLIDRLRPLAELLPALESADADFGHWDTSPPVDGVHRMPYFTLGPTAEVFISAVARGGWMMMGFDWMTWLRTGEGEALRDRPEALDTASPDDLARLLTAIVRSDRFVEGSMVGAFESGLLARIARRAAVLLAEAEV